MRILRFGQHLDLAGINLVFHVALLQVTKMNVYYWKEKVPGSYHVKKRFPCFIQTEGKESKLHIYGLPSNEYPGLMKVCNNSSILLGLLYSVRV